MAQFDPNALQSLNDERDALETQLRDSKTAYTANTNPTTSDISTDVKLTGLKSAIAKLEGQKIREDWYGPTAPTGADAQVAGTSEGIFSKGLNALARPLYAVTGAAEWALGKGTKKGLLDNINANMNERETFGNLIRKYDVPQVVSIPLGFAMDVAFDPVNWATAGTSALIPRMGVGAVKGGLEGIREGAISGLGSKVIGVANKVPFLKSSEKVSNLLGNFSERAIQATDRYNSIIGRDPISSMGSGIFGASNLNQGRTLGNTVENFLASMPGGQKLVEKFKYSPQDWSKVAQIKDFISKQKVEEGKAFGKFAEGVFPDARTAQSTIAPTVSELEQAMKKTPGGSDPFMSLEQASENPGNTFSGKTPEANKLADIISGGEHIGVNSPEYARSSDAAESYSRLLEEADIDHELKHVVSAMDRLDAQSTGFSMYDNAIKNLKKFRLNDTPGLSNLPQNLGNTQPVKKVFDAYSSFISLFKRAKVGASIPAYLNSAIGNPTMAMMAGLDITRPEYLKSVKKALDFVTGKQSDEFIMKNFLDEGLGWVDFADKNPSFFSRTYGFDPKALAAKSFIDRAIATGKEAGLITANNSADIEKSLKEALTDAGKVYTDSAAARTAERGTAGDIIDRSMKFKKEPKTTPMEMTEKLIQGGSSASDLPGSWAANEIQGTEMIDKVGKYVAEKAKDGNVGYKLLDALFNKSMNLYERSDQAYKLGTAAHLTNSGVTEQELKLISRFVKIDPSEVISKYADKGQYFYRLSPKIATNVANEIYMNYNAMPAAVKVLRSLPVLGSPFVSFQYAMGAKMGKTLLHNPAVFNKMNFFLNEISGDKSPLEKEALKSKYSSYLNAPGTIKLPFFQDNPMYMDVANMIPYYTMNMFVPSERKYESTIPGTVMSILDKTPILKDPIGQTIFDYFIQPMLLSKQDTPQGQFGQPIYPRGSNFGQKSLYALRNVAEAPVPGVAGLLGLPAGLMTPGVTDYVPSYKFRQLANATQGKDSLGAVTKESPSSKTIRAILSNMGISVHPLDLTYLSNQVNKKK